MNKTEKIVVLLATVFCLVVFSGSAFAQPFAQAEGLLPPQTCFNYELGGWNTFEGSWLIGHSVNSPMGGTLGQISDLVIDQANDRIALVILSDVPGFGAKLVAVPYGSLIRVSENIFQISLPSAVTTSEYYRGMVAGIPPSTIDSNWAASVYRNYELTPYWEEKGEQPLMKLYRSTVLIGAEVRSPEGEDMAKVDDIIINSPDGQIVFLSLQNVSRKGDSLVAVPFSLLSRNEENTFSLNVAKEKLSAAPTFNESADISNRAWAQNDYRFFGAQPCWTEEGMQ